jgi:hypothetical protein
LANRSGNPLFKDPQFQAAQREKKAKKLRVDPHATPPPSDPAEIYKLIDQKIDQHLVQLVEVMINHALQGQGQNSLKAAEYLVNRRLGPPKNAANEAEAFQQFIRELATSLHASDESSSSPLPARPERETDLGTASEDLPDGGLYPWERTTDLPPGNWP